MSMLECWLTSRDRKRNRYGVEMEMQGIMTDALFLLLLVLPVCVYNTAFNAPTCPSGQQFDVPRNGEENNRLWAAAASKNVEQVHKTWLIHGTRSNRAKGVTHVCTL